MGLRIEENCYVHYILFADNQVVIARGTEDANYIGIKLDESEKWTYNKLRNTGHLVMGHSEKFHINGNTISTVEQFKNF
jgi:hypothetical protein